MKYSFFASLDENNSIFIPNSKNTHFCPNKSYEKFLHFVWDGEIFIDSERFNHVFVNFVCENKMKKVNKQCLLDTHAQ